jgi:hypothetical protein
LNLVLHFQESDISRLKNGLRESEKTLRYKEEYIEELRNSLSWRLTRPLRAAYDLLFQKKEIK